MTRFAATTALALGLFATPAFAACLDEIAVVEQTLETAAIGDADRAALQAVVDTAKAQADNGEEDACMATITEAKTLLGL